MDVAGSAAGVVSASADQGYGAFGSQSAGVPEKGGHVDAMATLSLWMMRRMSEVVIRRHGLRMAQHLLNFRKKELSRAQISDLSLGLNSNRRFPTEKAWDGGNPIVEYGIHRNSGSSDDGSIISNEIHYRISSEGYCHEQFVDGSIGDITNTIDACKRFVEFADTRVLVTGEMMSCQQGKGSLLLVEHNIICQAFLVLILYSRRDRYKKIVSCLLCPLMKIWTLPEWRSNYLQLGPRLTRLFSDSLFLKAVHYMIRIFELELQRSRTEGFTALNYSETLLQFILPLLLELLQCIHGLWYPPIAVALSEELKRAKHPHPSFPLACANELLCIKVKEDHKENETRALLEGVLESGYNIIGLCASIEGGFFKLLNGFHVSVALSKYLGSLEFRHLRKLIKLTIIPLVKNCPRKFWKEWVDNLLRPLLRHSEKILHYAWSSILYHEHAGVPYYFGELSGSSEKIKTLERDILLEFTRDFSALLEVLALTEQINALPQEDVTHDSDSMPSTSLFRYLVSNECFGSLRMSLFGYFVDDTATSRAVPFCRALVCLAVGSNDARLRIFVVDNLLPCLIQSLDNRLPCAIQSLKCKLNSGASGNASRDLVVLCKELYNYMLIEHVQTQGLLGEDKISDTAGKRFKPWLLGQKRIFQFKAHCAAAKKLPNGCRWHWELEDECQRYLSAYTDMVREVDAIGDFAEHIYLDKESLFQKLRPEFRSKYAINNCLHPYMATISSIQQRKFYSMETVVRNRKIRDLVCRLIKLKPYIKGSDCSFDVIYRLKRTSEIPTELSKYAAPAVEVLLRILSIWEPRFHPMIREAIMDKLLGAVDALTTSEYIKPVEPVVKDFPLHLQPYARAFVETTLKNSNYYVAKEQILLHEAFDMLMASGVLDDYMGCFISKENFLEHLFRDELVRSQFQLLEHSLIKLSFERRVQIVSLQDEICTYTKCLCFLQKNEPLRLYIKSLISKLEAEGFFDVNSSEVNWGKESFSDSIVEFGHLFCSSLPKHYTIQGLIDCRTILIHDDIDWQEAFTKVFAELRAGLSDDLRKFWEGTRYYEHEYYTVARDPLKQVIFCALA
ncbi:unnamed protein product [Urochloa decumbens]|uniref:Exportin-5 C-terminal domain-containing protein n=1 Tax=Urochloa decumbens TaxID=240449 RepID=A0ABC9A9M6_9POAL